MDLHKRSCLERAKQQLAVDTDAGLHYACLELRFCMESICYDKLRLYEKDISPAELEAWQPKKVVETMLEYDDDVERDYTLRIMPEDSTGQPGAPIFADTFRALKISTIKKHYSKLGNYLHVPTPAQSRKHSPARYDELRSYLIGLVKELEPLAANTFDTNIAETYTFTCECCGKRFVRNARSVRNGKLVTCPEANCGARFDLHEEGDQVALKLQQGIFTCEGCGKESTVPVHKIANGVTIECIHCKAPTRVMQVYRLEFLGTSTKSAGQAPPNEQAD